MFESINKKVHVLKIEKGIWESHNLTSTVSPNQLSRADDLF